jgi:redox-sensitive bicupin YhaK (pirin superfamily)
MELKKVKYSLPAVTIDMGGLPVKQALPTNNVDQIDPFLLLHHGQIKPIYNRPALSQGVGPHPHRGFSPVTFVIDGEVHHRDSRGNNQVAKAGEVQWMHSGLGIVHSERPSEHLLAEKGHMEIVQLWINSPAKSKMKEPDYQYISKADMSYHTSDDGLVVTNVIAGKFGDFTGKIRMQSELLVLWGSAKEGGKERYSVPNEFNSSIYLIRGNMHIEGFGIVDPESLIAFETEGDEISLTFTSDAQFLVLTGKPIGEKVTQHGPFVMNTQTEIMEAMRDYQMGKMGILIEE